VKENSVYQKLEKGDYELSSPLTDAERRVLEEYVELFNPESGKVPSNRDLALELGMTRNEIKRLRVSIARKIDIIRPGW